ncbi:DUF2813 domain-containing protein, partial [Pseudomonas luteola]|uniref:AAA family ATPase n=1 Tax=Pseudomonas luteola TaxID=47886 RepID=UPI000F77211C
MAIIEKVEIKGFWATHEVSINFNEDVNFLIGINGSGKTTILNLISACLNTRRLPRFEYRPALESNPSNQEIGHEEA